jgi:hypothetical protein
MITYFFQKEADLDSLSSSIRSEIVTELDHATNYGSDLQLFFTQKLSDEEEVALNRIISEHVKKLLAIEAPYSGPTFSYFFKNENVIWGSIESLEAAIIATELSAGLKHITMFESEIEIVFYSPLNADDEAALNNVVLYQ